MPPYHGVVTDPFRRKAPDGRTYFDILEPPSGLVQVYTTLAGEISLCRVEAARASDPVIRTFWTQKGALLDRANREFQVGLEKLALRTAVVADERIKRHIDTTRVRDPTSKSRHLEDNIASRAVNTALPLGIVGVAAIDQLDKTKRPSTGSYWEAQEFGSTAAVGRKLRGFFQPGNVPPDPSAFRDQAEFRLDARARRRMVVKRPIEERGFLRRGVEDAGRYRSRQLQTLKNQLIRELRKARAMKPPPASLIPQRPQRRRR